MWKHEVLTAVYKLNSYLTASGLGRSSLASSVRRVGKELLQRLHVLDNLVRAEVDGLPMYIRPAFRNDYIEKPYEPHTTELFKATLKPGATVLDIGAHFGYFSLIAANRVGKRGRVYAFEPGPDNFHILSLNAALNGYTNLFPIQKAVGARAETLQLNFTEHGHFSLSPHPFSPTVAVLPVAAIAIDQFLKGRPADVVKIDIEGGEPFALEGMKETIRRSPHLVLFVEFSPLCLTQVGAEPQAFLAQLEEMGFTVQLIDDYECTATPVNQERLLEIYDGCTWPTNFYCVRRES